MKKKKILIALTTGFMMFTTLTAYAGTWEQDSKGWKYKDNNGQYTTGWVLDNGKYYYFGNDCYMLADTITPDGYNVNVSGEWIDGLTAKSGNWNVSSETVSDIVVQGNGLIAVFESRASYNQGDITLTKSGYEYAFEIRVNLSKAPNRNAIQQLSRLTAINGLGDLLLNDNDNKVYQLDNWQDMGNGHQVYVSQSGKTLTYKIK